MFLYRNEKLYKLLNFMKYLDRFKIKRLAYLDTSCST